MYRFLTASKELCQHARSALLGAYRCFVVQELKSHLPQGGYTVWIAQSTLRRTEEHMASLAEFTASTVSLSLPDILFDCQTVTMPEDLFAYDDDDDDDDVEMNHDQDTKAKAAAPPLKLQFDMEWDTFLCARYSCC